MTARAEPAGGMTEPHLLVVDDDARLRELLRRYLVDQGFRVTTAADAAEARAKLKSLDFDLLVLDVMMPGEDGFALTAQPARNQPDSDPAADRHGREPRTASTGSSAAPTIIWSSRSSRASWCCASEHAHPRGARCRKRPASCGSGLPAGFEARRALPRSESGASSPAPKRRC